MGLIGIGVQGEIWGCMSIYVPFGVVCRSVKNLYVHSAGILYKEKDMLDLSF